MNADNPVNQSKLELIPWSQHKGRERVCERVAVGFSFTSDWLRKQLEIFKPITRRSRAKSSKCELHSALSEKSYIALLAQWFSSYLE